MKKAASKVGAAIGLVLLVILGFHYFYNFNILKEPPSSLWSKEVKVGQGKMNTSSILIKEENRLLIGYLDGKNLHVSVSDLQGKVKEEKEYPIEEEFIKNIVFLKTKDGYMLGYNSTVNGTGYMDKLLLDKDLTLIKKDRVEKIREVYQLSNSNYLIAFENRISIIDEQSQEISVPAKDIGMITGSKTKTGFLVCYLEGKETFKFTTVENGKIAEPKTAINLNKPDSVSYNKISCSTDGVKGYILLEEAVKGEFSGSKGIEFNLDGSDSKFKQVYVNESDVIYDNIGMYSEDGGKFYGTSTRPVGRKSSEPAIVSFTFKDEATKDVEYVSRLRELTLYPYVEEDYVSFISFSKNGIYDINIASTNDKFKEVNNGTRTSERTGALWMTLEGLLYSISFIFVYGLRWVFPVAMVAGIYSFFDYSYSEKRKLRGFLILSLFGIILKTSSILKISYTDYIALLPEPLAYKGIGILICAILGILSYAFGYLLYKKDTEEMIIIKFSIALIIDTMLTLAVFVPLIA